MLSAFEAALLDRHLRRCESCRAFAGAATAQTSLLRRAKLEQPTFSVTLPEPRRPRRAAAAGVASLSLVAAAVAAALVLLPGANRTRGLETTARATARGAGVPAIVVFAASPLPSPSKVDVPRLRLQRAPETDGPVHGYFNVPV
jgi:predicted anti-sigma-YlaC factor YlaD